MRIGIVVNTMASQEYGATTYRIAAECVNKGFKVYLMSTGNFSYNEDDTIGALARTVPPGKYTSETFLKVFKSDQAKDRWITNADLDVLLLRTLPFVQSPWAQGVGINFGRLAARHGVIVLNDPDGLAGATTKLYLQNFPESVRPRTLVTRSASQIKKFARKEGTIILKPLQGSGGASVFIVRPEHEHNIDEMINAVSRDGYIIAQEYLPAAEAGDTRLFLMNGVPLQYQGKYAAFRRIRTGDDIRSNIHAGGRLRKAVLTDTMFQLADAVRPRLVEDGMFLVGLDIVGDKLMEINVFTPGGLGSAQRFEKVDFTQAIIEALQKKIEYNRNYSQKYSNARLAVL